MKTILTVKQQNNFLNTNWAINTLEFKWSCRGYGSTTVFDSRQNKLLRVGGCGFDRRGTALGQFIELTFNDEIQKLAKKVTFGRGKNKRVSRDFYGMNIYQGKISLDGACGFDCMQKILAAIGFEIVNTGSTDNQKVTGSEFFTLKPISRDSWLLKSVNDFKKGVKL